MTVFEYRAINEGGKILIGTIEAASPAEVLEQLDRAGITAISTKPHDGALKRGWRERLTPDPKPEEITGFTLDLAMLLKGGAALPEALQIMKQMETRRWLVRLIGELNQQLSSGKSFSDALSRYPRFFPPIYVKMIEAAQASGRMERALADIAAERQRSEKLKKKLTSAIAYPAFLAVAALAVLTFVLLYLVPQFETAIVGFRDKLAPSALFVFNLSATLRANLDIAMALVALVLIGALALKTVGSKNGLWILLLSRLPLTRRVVSYHSTLTFCRTLGMLLDNGVDISTTLRLVGAMMRLPGVTASIDLVVADIRAGTRLSQALGKQSFLAPHVTHMLRIGEESGHLPDSAARIASFYEAKLDSALEKLTAVIGPLLMVTVSLLIGWVILSIMSALMSINDLLV